jgi:hypothetical protein
MQMLCKSSVEKYPSHFKQSVTSKPPQFGHVYFGLFDLHLLACVWRNMQLARSSANSVTLKLGSFNMVGESDVGKCQVWCDVGAVCQSCGTI